MNDLFWLSERQLEHIELSSPLSHCGVAQSMSPEPRLAIPARTPRRSLEGKDSQGIPPSSPLTGPDRPASTHQVFKCSKKGANALAA